MKVTAQPIQIKLNHRDASNLTLSSSTRTSIDQEIKATMSSKSKINDSTVNPKIIIDDEQPAVMDIDTNQESIEQQQNSNDTSTTDEENIERHFGTVSPMLNSSSSNSSISNSSNKSMKRNLSTIGATKATNFRINFQKSHTCGSLFANCNCSQIKTTTITAATTTTNSPTPAKARLLPFAILPAVTLNSETPLTTETTTETILTIVSDANERSNDWKSSKHSNNNGSTTSTYTTTNTSTAGLSHDSSSLCSSVDLTADGGIAAATTPELLQSSFQLQSMKSNSPGEINVIKAVATPADNKLQSEKIQTKTKRLFQSYSHPDTNFIFTDENRNPSRSSLTHRNNQSQVVVTSRGGKVEIKHPKRSSSPNIGHYQVLDVAVHPDILVKISPKHTTAAGAAAANEVRRTQSAITSKTTQQRRRLLRRSEEIESRDSTSDSEQSSPVVVEQLQDQQVRSAEKKCPVPPSPPLPPPSSPSTIARKKDTNDNSFDAARKYFQESGILGPINTSTNLIRKTSKILQDANVIEQIRKTSMILRAAKLSSTSSPKLPEDSNMDSPVQSPKSGHLLFQPEEFDGIWMMQADHRFTGNDQDAHQIIKNLQVEIVSLKDVIKSRDSEIMELRREVDKLKSVLQQTANQFPIARDDRSHAQPSPPPAYKTAADGLTSISVNCECCSNYQYVRQLSSGGSSSAAGTYSPDITADLPSNGNAIIASTADADIHTTTTTTTITNQTLPSAPSNTHVTCALVSNNNDADVSASVPILHRLKLKGCQVGGAPVLKKQGVSGESSSESSIQQSINVPIPKFEKDFRSKQLIKDAIMDNDFLKNIDSSQVRELVESMYSLAVAKGEYVIREGDVGAHLYVSAEGEFEVVKNGKVLGVMGAGKAFGELAILYNCTRTASVRVISDARVWVLDRRVFQQIMMRTGLQRIENSVNFLKSVPLLKNLSGDVLAKIADVLEVEFYPAGTYIIRQGATGDTFFLISQGEVRVTQKVGPSGVEKEIRTLQPGDYFGEQALINEDKRTANIIAMAPGVECLTLDRESFTHLIGNLSELKEKSYDDDEHCLPTATSYAEKAKEAFGANLTQEFPDMKLSDLEAVTTLGVGGFGRVELVKAYQENTVRIFALKCLKKKHIIETRQEEHIFSERTIMLACKSPFICRLHRTFRDDKYVYMLLEACMGGEVWTMLRDRGCFDENATQFIIACVLQAFEYLHARGIIYRDLKPENLMLDERGYVKLVDFGFAKHIGNGSKTWTFCGTPEYVAPEIILNKGHDRAVDYWALGILIHELLNGTPPFTANDPMKTYNIILKGIDMIDFPKHMTRSAVQLIKKLCRDVPAERLGYQKGGIQDIKKHKWFLGFDWDGLASQLLIPPFVRPIAHPTDTCYFDKFPSDSGADAPEEFSGWDDNF